jgi:hypothetical protein
MTNSDCPWEPPLAGTEAEQLAGALDRLRTTGHADLLREAVDGLVGEDPPPGWHAGSGQA